VLLLEGLATVRGANTVPGSSGCQLGVQFEQLSAQQRSELEFWLRSHESLLRRI
jgi:hypothetical protein